MESNNKNITGFGAQQERRRFIRLSLDPPIRVKFRFIPIGATLEGVRESEALIKNISVGGGLLIELILKSEEEKDRLLAGQEKISFDTGLPGVRPQIRISGKAAWLKKMDKPGLSYEAGVSFENIDAKIQESILYAMIDLAFKQGNIKAL